jgi:hypothetical protein
MRRPRNQRPKPRNARKTPNVAQLSRGLNRLRVRPARPIGVQERLRQKGHEFFQIITVPTDAFIGQNLFQLEVNPTMIPRLSVIASQYKQWKGDMKLHVESLGNAFSLSSVTSAFFPDPDPAELPSDPIALLRAIDAAPSKRNLHLQDTSIKTVDAPWSLTTNPWKFNVDTDPSDRANGLFVIISNGTPGSDPVNVKISLSYDITFQGNTFQPMIPALITPARTLASVTGGITSTEFTHPAFGSASVPYSADYTLAADLPVLTPDGTSIEIIPLGSLVTLGAYDASTRISVTFDSVIYNIGVISASSADLMTINIRFTAAPSMSNLLGSV